MWKLFTSSALSESFWGLIAGSGKSAKGLDSETRLINMRLQIIRLLKQRGLHDQSPLLCRVARAGEVQDLWYLRPEIMQCLASVHGETEARRIMDGRVAPLFAGVVKTCRGRQPVFAR